MWRTKKPKRRNKRTQTERERALADIAHSLQTPLAILKSELFFLKQEVPTDGRAILCDRLVDTISRRVNAFLHISTLEHALREEAPSRVSLSKILKEVANDVRPLAEVHAISVKTKLAPDCFIFGVHDKLYELSMNILSNSIKYMGFGATRVITITLSKNARHARISFADTGIGIPKEDIPHLYTSLFRGKNGEKRKNVPGNGLGLAIVKRIVEAHAGTIQTKSTSGRGTETVIRFPLST